MNDSTPEPLGSLPVDPAPRKTSWLVRLLTALGCLGAALFGFIFLAVAPRGMKARPQGQLTACKSNCKNIATALEMYASDNKGLYPHSFDLLISGNYLKQLPTCPSVGKVTYTNYQYSVKPDCFSFACVGNNHAPAYTGFSGSSDNYPRYHAESGLGDQP